jgi:hypothetical protein
MVQTLGQMLVYFATGAFLSNVLGLLDQFATNAYASNFIIKLVIKQQVLITQIFGLALVAAPRIQILWL